MVSGMQLDRVVRKNRLHSGPNASGLLLSEVNEINGPASCYAAGRSLHVPVLIIIIYNLAICKAAITLLLLASALSAG